MQLQLSLSCNINQQVSVCPPQSAYKSTVTEFVASSRTHLSQLQSFLGFKGVWVHCLHYRASKIPHNTHRGFRIHQISLLESAANPTRTFHHESPSQHKGGVRFKGIFHLLCFSMLHYFLVFGFWLTQIQVALMLTNVNRCIQRRNLCKGTLRTEKWLLYAAALNLFAGFQQYLLPFLFYKEELAVLLENISTTCAELKHCTSQKRNPGTDPASPEDWVSLPLEFPRESKGFRHQNYAHSLVCTTGGGVRRGFAVSRDI